MSNFDKNLDYIKSIGFKNDNFAGYGATVFKDEHGNELWWGEWSFLNYQKHGCKEIRIGNMCTEDLTDKIKRVTNG